MSAKKIIEKWLKQNSFGQTFNHWLNERHEKSYKTIRRLSINSMVILISLYMSIYIDNNDPKSFMNMILYPSKTFHILIIGDWPRIIVITYLLHVIYGFFINYIRYVYNFNEKFTLKLLTFVYLKPQQLRQSSIISSIRCNDKTLKQIDYLVHIADICQSIGIIGWSMCE